MRTTTWVVLLTLSLTFQFAGIAKAELGLQPPSRGIEPIARPGEPLMPRSVIVEIIPPTFDQPIGAIIFGVEDGDLVQETNFRGPR